MAKNKRNKKNNNNTKKAQKTSGPTSGPNVPPPNMQVHRLLGTVQRLRRTLSWTSYGNTQCPEGSTVQTNFRMNSAYQPLSAVSNNPYGFAKYMAFYAKCYVLGARIKATFVADTDNSSAITDQPYRFKGLVGISVSTTNPTIVPSDAISQSLTDYRCVGTTSQTGSVSIGLDVAKFLDKPRILDDPDLYCTSGAPPLDIIYGALWISADKNDVQLTNVVQIEFDVMFVDPLPFT